MKILIAAGQTTPLCEHCSLASFAPGHGWPGRGFAKAFRRATDGLAIRVQP